MGLTLGLDAALSGLTTAQRGLNVVSQNVSNVNTPGYTREIANLESVAMGGQGGGVQLAAVGRAVDQGLLKSIRAQATTMGGLDTEQQFLPQIQDMFGQVGDGTSIADTVTNMGAAFQALATSVSDPSQQFSTIQSALDVTGQLNAMTTTLQNLRVSADAQVSAAVDQVNQDLGSISSLNQQIVRGTAIGSNTGALQDQRDSAVTDLAKYIDIQYFQRSDGSMTVYTGAGKVLVDGNQTVTLDHPAASITAPWMTAAGGQFGPITLSSDPDTDISASINGGELRALLDLRDTTIPDLQSQLDQMTATMTDTVNQISNRGTSQPALANSYSGSTTFATQGTITPSAGDVASTITFDQGAGTMTAATYGSLGFSYSTTDGQATLTAANPIFQLPPGTGSSTLMGTGDTFTVGNSPTGPNDGTYTVVKVLSATSAEVRKANPIQTFSLANGADTAVTLFDTSGNQIATTTLNAIMTTDYRGQYGQSAGDPQAAAQSLGGPWSIDSFSKHLQSWLQAQGYAGASVGLDGSGHMQINLGSTARASLAFRDQVSSAPGAAAQDATVNFDVDGDGTPDQTVQGFSNFFGLNDVFTSTQPAAVMDSAIQPASYRVPASTPQRTLALSDPSGQIGPAMTIPAGSTLQDIATEINNDTQTNDSALQSSASVSLGSAATFSVEDANGLVESATVGPGTVTLQDMANALTAGTVTAQVVQDGSQYRLRLFDSRGVPLTVGITGGALAGSGAATLGSQLGMAQAHRVQAAVVPDGSGYRLRIVQSDGRQLFASANQDATGASLLTGLGLATAAAGDSGTVAVRPGLLGNPSTVPRGAVQWNADTGQYYLSEGDNTTALAMADALGAKQSMAAAGQIPAGSYTLSEHAATTISGAAAAANDAQSQQSYQATLQDSLNYQYASASGVNLDEEVANMITFQQAFAASSRMISSLDSMLQTLGDLVP